MTRRSLIALGVLAGCQTGRKSPPAETVVPKSASNGHLEPSPELRKLWNLWRGRYSIYIHRNAGIHEFADLRNRLLYVALMARRPDGRDLPQLRKDAEAFLGAARLRTPINWETRLEMYRAVLLGHPEAIGFMLPWVAGQLKLDSEHDLIRLVFE